VKAYLILVLKGIAMGAANVIPGVSGGTVALITNIFERLVNAIKSFDLQALRLLQRGAYRAFVEHVGLYFLLAVGCGVAISIITLARLFEFLFETYPVQIWAYFFGLILASVYCVGRTVAHWSPGVICAFVVGTALAAGITFVNPAAPNASFAYLFVCGVVAMCSMILPGLSGSFVLILMGNYELILQSVNTLDLAILTPVGMGAIVGIMLFARVLSWLYRRFRDQTIALLTGFILGSLGVIWPWKYPHYLYDAAGELVMRHGKPLIQSYAYALPRGLDAELLAAGALACAGIATIVVMEYLAAGKQTAQAP
jgi:putative membrane protein